MIETGKLFAKRHTSCEVGIAGDADTTPNAGDALAYGTLGCGQLNVLRRSDVDAFPLRDHHRALLETTLGS